jgi:amino-acid N-acetyltransferase
MTAMALLTPPGTESMPETASPDTPSLRDGRASDAPAILALIEANLAAGHLLPRTRADIDRHVARFLVVTAGDALIGCAELAPLSLAVAEVRSLVIDEGWRGRGLGTRLIEALGARARDNEFSILCAFTHDPHHFVRLGFTIVPHVWFPEKVALDCTSCIKFRVCGQHALALSLTSASLMPTLRRLREPITTHRAPDATIDTLRPVKLRVIP